MEQTILPVEAIQERDVDLILLEELSTDNSFCEWFIRELDLTTRVLAIYKYNLLVCNQKATNFLVTL